MVGNGVRLRVCEPFTTKNARGWVLPMLGMLVPKDERLGRCGKQWSCTTVQADGTVTDCRTAH